MSRFILASALLAGASACGSSPDVRGISNVGGRGVITEDHTRSADAGRGMGLESDDFAQLADKMVRSMLQNPRLAGGDRPLVGISASRFNNNSDLHKLDMGLFVDSLRTKLFLAASDRIRFVAEDSTDDVEQLRGERGAGLHTGTRAVGRVVGADYFLDGVIRDQRTVHESTGIQRQYILVVMTMVDVNRELVWTDQFEVRRSAVDDAVYR